MLSDPLPVKVYADGTIRIGDLTVDLRVVYAMISPDPRVLWRFVEQDGRVQAIPYSEGEVVWLEKNAP